MAIQKNPSKCPATFQQMPKSLIPFLFKFKFKCIEMPILSTQNDIMDGNYSDSPSYAYLWHLLTREVESRRLPTKILPLEAIRL